MRFEVITSRTTTITDTVVAEVEADTPEEALLLAEELPQPLGTTESQTSELTYAVSCLPGTPANIQACRRFLAARSAKSQDADKHRSQPAIYDEAYFQFIEHLEKHGLQATAKDGSQDSSTSHPNQVAFLLPKPLTAHSKSQPNYNPFSPKTCFSFFTCLNKYYNNRYSRIEHEQQHQPNPSNQWPRRLS